MAILLSIVLISAAAITGSVQSSQAAPGSTDGPGKLMLASGGNTVPVQKPSTTATATPTPKPLPAVTRNTSTTPLSPTNISLGFNPKDGFYTGSPLLYVADEHNVSVIELDTNKVVDVIYLNKEKIIDVAVSPDYYTLYVLYNGHADPAKLMPGEEDPYANFIMAIDLYSKRVIADTWYSGDYQYLIGGTASNLALSPDGKYLYFAISSLDMSMIFQYDTAAHAYIRGVTPGKLYSSYGTVDSNAWDLTVSPDGKYLYFADTRRGVLTVMNLPDLSMRSAYSTLGIDLAPWSLSLSADQSHYYVAGDIESDTGYAITALEPAAYSPQEMTGVSSLLFSTRVSLIRLSPDGQTMYIIEPAEKRVIGYNVNTPSDCRIFNTGSQTGDIAFSPDGSKLYVYSYGNSYVMVFDLNTGQQLAGTPIALGPDQKLGNGWSFADSHRMEMGPMPQNDVFVNDSAYRAHQLSALPNMAGTLSAVKYLGPLVTKDNNATGSGWSSFALESGTGRLVLVNLTGTATATPTPKPPGSSPGPKVTLIPFPMPDVNTGPQENQSQGATPQAGNDTNTPTPGAGTNATPTAKATPGPTALLCLAGLILIALAAKRRTR
jgi:Tol biopolymer transport system component